MVLALVFIGSGVQGAHSDIMAARDANRHMDFTGNQIFQLQRKLGDIEPKEEYTGILAENYVYGTRNSDLGSQNRSGNNSTDRFDQGAQSLNSKLTNEVEFYLKGSNAKLEDYAAKNGIKLISEGRSPNDQ